MKSMAPRPLLLSAAAYVASAADPAAGSIGKVVDTLSDILVTVENEEKAEAKSYKEYGAWCQKQTMDLPKAIQTETLRAENARGSVQELTASVAQLQQVLDDNAKDIRESQDTVSQAESIRQGDNEKYQDDMELNSQSLNQVTKAIKILGDVHGGSFLQRAVRRQEVESGEPGESSMVLGIMKGLQDKLQTSRQGLEGSESKAVTEHEKLVGGERQRITALQDSNQAKSEELTTSRVSLVQAKRIVERTDTSIRELNKVLEDTSAECAEKAKWWATRREDRKNEKNALREAIDFLNKAPKSDEKAESFVQISAHRNTGKMVLASANTQHQAWLGAAVAQLSALQVSGGGDALGPAKKVVADLIVVLQKEQSAEGSKKKYCKAELEKKTDEKKKAEDEIQRLEAAIERKTAEGDALKAEVESIEAELDKMKTQLEEAAKIRKQEKAIFEAGTRDRSLALKVLAQAKQVLNQFYSSADRTGLAQISYQVANSDKPPPLPSGGSSRKELRSGNAIAMLDRIADDIRREQKDAEIEESTAATRFSKLQEDSREDFDEQMRAITERVKVKAATRVHLGTDTETVTQTRADHAAVALQLTSLHEQCDELLTNFDQRTKDREFEVSQLRDVVDILAGSSAAVRTGLLEQSKQVESDALDQREQELMRDLSQAATGLAASTSASTTH